MFTQKSRYPTTFQVITNNIDKEISSVPFISISMIYNKMPELQEEYHPTSAYFYVAHRCLHKACLHLHGTTRNSASKFILFHRRNTTLKNSRKGRSFNIWSCSILNFFITRYVLVLHVTVFDRKSQTLHSKLHCILNSLKVKSCCSTSILPTAQKETYSV